MQISACIIAKNAQKTLKECLSSLKEFDEIILLDNESSDETLQVAKEFQKTFSNLHIFSSPFIGFGALKNLALSRAKNEWIFSIDADEVLEKEALKEIKSLVLQSDHVYALPRKNLYKKEWIKACGWYPDYVLRLFNKNFTHFNDNVVHENVKLGENAKIIKLQNGLKHYAYDDIYTLLDKMQRYSNLWVEQNLHKKSSMSKALLRSFWKFARDYFFKKGLFYGYKGFIISICNALGVFFKYTKLYELKKTPPTCSLIITTYNSPHFLRLVLESVRDLAYLPNEVIIADDGSTSQTAELIKEFQGAFPCELRHIWQVDEGFRAGTIRNKAVKVAKYEYIIIIDGDMILEPHFIRDHLDFARHKVYLQGSRIILDESKTKDLLNRGQERKKLLPKPFKARRCNFLSKFIYKNSKISASFFEKKSLIKGSKSCNMSCFKKDYEAINGFNEKFIGWGREDSEFTARFLYNGGEFRRLKFKGIAYHLYHNEQNKSNNPEFLKNHELYLQSLENAKQGFVKANEDKITLCL